MKTIEAFTIHKDYQKVSKKRKLEVLALLLTWISSEVSKLNKQFTKERDKGFELTINVTEELYI